MQNLSVDFFKEKTSYSSYLVEILNFYVSLALKLPSLRNDPQFMKEEVKAVGLGGVTDVATYSDKYMQKKIKENIQKLHSDWGFWGEEGKDRIAELDKSKPFTLVTDPIEGTNNFKRNIDDQWGSVIALIENKTGIPVIGIVAHPKYKKFYVGVKEAGAFVLTYDENNNLTDFQPMNKEPEKAKFSYNNSPHFSKELFQQSSSFMKLGKILETNELARSTIAIPNENGQIFEDPESGALEVLRYKGTIYFKTSAEMAAVFVILQELGGKITDATGKPWSITINSLIAARNEKDYNYLKELFDKTK